MEIVYCVDCGRKLREHDFVRGAAYTRNKQHYCTTCRPLDPQAAAPAPKPKSTRSLPAARPAARNSRRPLLVAAAAGGLLLLGGAAAVVLSPGRGSTSAVDEAAARESLERTKREADARDAVQRAKVFEASNPKDLDGLVQAWKKAAPLCEKTSYAKEARQSLDRAAAARDADRDRAEAAKRALGPPPAWAWDFETLDGELYAGARSPGVDLVDGLVGKAVRFNGKGFLRIDAADVFNAPDLTVCLWIKPAGVKGRQGLLSKRVDSKQSPVVLSLWDGAIAFEAADESTQWPFQVRTLPLVKAGEWCHVALVARTGRGLELYLNGALVKELKIDGRRCRNSDPMFLGREMFNGSDAHDGSALYTGLLDELKVWVRPLSAPEIKAHYEAGAPK